MERFISARSKNDLLKLGLYQIVGACFGLVLILWLLSGKKTWTTPEVIMTFIGMLPFSFSIFTGYQCLKMKERALTLSYINQGIQLVGFNILGFAFIYAPCIYVYFTVDLTENLKFLVNAAIFGYRIDFHTQSRVIAININLIALIAFVWLGKIDDRIKNEVEIMTDTRFL
jgi:hypothetical protein